MRKSKLDKFGDWVEEHRNELLDEALKRLKGHRADAEDAVQNALLGMMESPEFKRRSIAKLWPWASEVVRAHAAVIRRSYRRAMAARQEAGGLLQVERGRNTGNSRTPLPTHEEDGNTHVPVGHRATGEVFGPDPAAPDFEATEPQTDEAGKFAGPTGWKGEITIAHLGRCCSAEQFSRVEIGKDIDRRKRNIAATTRILTELAASVQSKPAGSIERLAAYLLGCVAIEAAPIRTEWFVEQVLGCWNGHRTYTGAFRVGAHQKEELTMIADRLLVVYTDGSLDIRPYASGVCALLSAERKPWTGGPHEHSKFIRRFGCGLCRAESPTPYTGQCKHGIPPAIDAEGVVRGGCAACHVVAA